MASAAERFLSEIEQSWDRLDPYEATAEKGLSEVDEDALRSYCGESEEDYQTAEAEVLSFVRAKVANALHRN